MGSLYLLNYDDELQVLAMRYEIPRVGVNPEEVVGDTCPWPDADGVHAHRIGAVAQEDSPAPRIRILIRRVRGNYVARAARRNQVPPPRSGRSMLAT